AEAAVRNAGQRNLFISRNHGWLFFGCVCVSLLSPMTPLRRLTVVFLLGLIPASLALGQQFNAVLFTKTDGWHHDSINAGVTAIQELAKLHDFTVFWTEDANRVFTDEQLKKYQVVIFLLTTGDVLNDEQQDRKSVV